MSKPEVTSSHNDLATKTQSRHEEGIGGSNSFEVTSSKDADIASKISQMTFDNNVIDHSNINNSLDVLTSHLSQFDNKISEVTGSPVDISKFSTNKLNVSEVENTLISKKDTTQYTSDGPRKNYIGWHEFFMAAAFLTAKRSKDPTTQVGACIVNKDNKIVGMGYNGMPIGCDDKDFPWGKSNDRLNSKYMYVCHAEMNAVLNKNSADLKDCRIYVGLFPCNECTKIIIQSGIREVIYLSDKHAHKVETVGAKRMFMSSGVKFWQYIPKNEEIVIKFSDINWNNMSQVATL